MPKVPVYDAPQVESRPLYSGGGPAQFRAHTDVANALGQLGGALGQAGAEVQQGQDRRAREAMARADEAHRKANALNITSALTELENASTTTLSGDSANGVTGFLSSEGRTAHDAAHGAYESFDKTQAKLADGLANEEQRKEFNLRAAQLRADFQRRVESHVGQQTRVAQEQEVGNATAAALKGTFLAPEAGGLYLRQTEDSIRALYSPSEAEGKVSQFREQLVLSQVAGYLAGDVPNLAHAEEALAARKDWLSPKTFEMADEQIRLKKRALEAKSVDAQAEALVRGWVTETTTKYGYLDEQALDSKLKGFDAGSPLFKEAQRAVEEQKRLGAAHLKTDRERWKQQILAAERLHQRWPAEAELRLSNVDIGDNEFLIRVEKDRLQERRAAQVYARGTKAEIDVARREQSDRDKEARLDFLAMPAEERSKTNIDIFLAGRGVSKVGRAQLGVDQRVANDALQKGDVKGENEMTSLADDVAKRLLVNKKTGKPLPGQDPVRFRAAAVQAYQDLKTELKREPTKEEKEKALSDLTREVVTDPGWLFGLGEKKAPQYQVAPKPAEKPAAPPAPAPPVKSTLKPGRYTDKQGRTVVVDANGTKRFE